MGKYPEFPFIKGIDTKKLHMYTFIQFLCLVVLYVLKSIKAIAVVFPFFLIVIAFVRMFLSKMFTKEELFVLDGPSVLIPEEDVKAATKDQGELTMRQGHSMEDMKNEYVPKEQEKEHDYDEAMRRPSYVNDKVAEDIKN